MIGFFRSLFGLSGSSGRRIAVGHPVNFEVKDVHYISDSKARMTSLHQLYNRFKNTPHAPKLKAVYAKTKAIQDYLISKNSLHELELFHIQHTEHFINTFTAIIDLHQQEVPVDAPTVQERSHFAEPRLKTFKEHFRTEKLKGHPLDKKPGMERHVNGRESYSPGTVAEAGEPALSLPTVSINTFEKIPYFPVGLPAKAIGYTSTEQEKEDFLRYLSFHLGIAIDKLSYMGNASVNISENSSQESSNLFPIIHWKGFLYALSLNNYRLYPVKTFRRGL